MSSDGVAVVIPTKDRRELLSRTLTSVAAQEGVDVEVIVIDDAGQVDLSSIGHQSGLPHLRLIRHTNNRGVSAARNTGLAAATAKWVAFVDDDDLWAPSKLRRQLQGLEQDATCRWSCVGALHVNSALQVSEHSPPPPTGNVSRELRALNAIPGGGSGIVVETGLARDVGGFDESASILADWDFYYRLGLRSGVSAVNAPLLAYYVHADSMYHNPRALLAELAYLERKYSSLPADVRLEFDRLFWFPVLMQMAWRLRTPVDLAALSADAIKDRRRMLILHHFARGVIKRIRGRQRRDRFAYEPSQYTWLDSQRTSL